MKCVNCGSQMSCSCQKRVTPNGIVGCTRCISSLTNNNNNVTITIDTSKNNPNNK